MPDRRLIAPEWLTIRILVRAAETGSLSHAARDCAIATSAAARRVQLLEEACGVALLERLPRGVRPTAAGEAFLCHAHTHVEVASRPTDEMRAFAAGGARRPRRAPSPAARTASSPASTSRWSAGTRRPPSRCCTSPSTARRRG
ncbi:LysR family transcriptional regulator [Muricoccus radiodurans]|uniref:LysR family transcriptional regulator n=1 Tax=Muricoccus radiodurans TaxID=2231721 RepID=UPI003CE8EFCC